MSLLESPMLENVSSPHGSTSLSTEAYVLSLASLPAHYAAAASAPSNFIDLFDKTTLQGVQTLAGHEVATTSLQAVDSIAGISRRVLISSGKDGTLRTWDERSNSVGIKSERYNLVHIPRTLPVLYNLSKVSVSSSVYRRQIAPLTLL